MALSRLPYLHRPFTIVLMEKEPISTPEILPAEFYGENTLGEVALQVEVEYPETD